MRKLVSITVLAVASLASFGASPDLGSLKIHVRQAFRAGQSVLPAGEYTIRPLGVVGEQPVLVFQSKDGESVLVPAMRYAPPALSGGAKTEVVLQREDGGGLVMTTVWLGSTDAGFRLINAPAPILSAPASE